MGGMHRRVSCSSSLRSIILLWKEAGHLEGQSTHRQNELLAGTKYVDSKSKRPVGKTVKIGVMRANLAYVGGRGRKMNKIKKL